MYMKFKNKNPFKLKIQKLNKDERSGCCDFIAGSSPIQIATKRLNLGFYCIRQITIHKRQLKVAKDKIVAVSIFNALDPSRP